MGVLENEATIEQEISANQRSVVLRVRDTGGQYVMKVCRYAEEPLEQAWKLQHANVCRIYAAAVIGELLFLKMEYIAGVDLQKLINERPLTLEQKVEILRQIANGLSYLHQNHIINGDLTAQNILVQMDPETDGLTVKICDYLSNELTNFLCQAPESFDVAWKKTKASDIWQFGVIAYQLLKARFPFQTVSEICTGKLKIPPDAPAGLQIIILRCLEKNPKNRLTMQNIKRKLDQPTKELMVPALNSLETVGDEDFDFE